MVFNDYRDNDLSKYRVFSGGTPPASDNTNLKIGRKEATHVTHVSLVDFADDLTTVSGGAYGSYLKS